MRLANESDLQERLSYIQQSAHHEDHDLLDEYSEAKSPRPVDVSGALVPGGALNLCSMEAMGLFAQYAAIGVVFSMIPSLNYPIFNVYLNMEGYQTAAYTVLVTLGWSFKVVFGMLSDCCPIFGYRRKSWMLIGWGVTMICLAVMAFSDVGPPFCNRENVQFATYCGKPLESVPPDVLEANFNLGAPDNGSKFILLSMVVSFGYVLAACASDAMVVQYAQREPEAIRGRVQTAVYTVRTVTGMAAVAVITFGLNGANYNGSFSFALSPNVPYGICLVPCVLVFCTTIFLLVEEKTPAIPLRVWCGDFWGLLQKRVMWQICAFRFINNTFNWVGATPSSPIQTYWAKVTPLNDSLSNMIGKAIFATTLAVVAKWGLHWNWRWIIALGSVGVVVVDAIVIYLTIWDVVRNQWFFTGVGLSENIPDGVRFIVATYCAVEVADPGVEGATYGLITTMNNLAAPLASVIYKFVDSYYDVTNNDIKADTTHVRWDATYVYLISYGSKLFALVWLFMLPPQKREVQELKRHGGTSKVAGAVLIALFLGALSFSMVSNFMSISPSTKCYRIAGGNGKTDPTTGGCPTPKT
ncbi:hypothetical protein DYB26_005838 [Aphanomyces astaci]|uniref:Major facilitator superfamily (MFS) profile domain-containing protein n=2 Tax=Aphanomyces astaci TaxID=112090 RepID=A0A397EZZ6_APHAT|nr:hypothetical protein DYB34_002963 [Aphanomyces astaci]RHY85600.1 hypothetical protein DYB26_005838 [Aphanomyces astaci]RHZ09038.1 hypothetical protein DYB31_005866 [Aphanomyces astaci]